MRAHRAWFFSPWVVGTLSGATVAATSEPVRGQRADLCLSTPVDGQKLQRAGKLLDAHDRFAVCARNTCPAEIVQDCTRWSREVDDALPSVVMAARDSWGRDLVDVRVSIDGGSLVSLSARAVPLDPGQHHFVFARTGGAAVEQDAVLREGEKNRELVAIFRPGPPSPAPPPAAPQPASPASERPERPVPVAAWIIGGLGAATVASFAAFAIAGIEQRSSDGCSKGCTSSQSDSVNLKFRIADISLGVGVVAVGVATWLYLSRPVVTRHDRRTPGAAVLGPTVYKGISVDMHLAKGGGWASIGASF